MKSVYSKEQKTIPIPANKKIVLVGGCFDILHVGHIQFLEKARQTSDYLVIALEPDERIIQYKKRIPVHTQHERAHNLLALRFVDHVICLQQLDGFEDYLALVTAVNPTIIAVTRNDPQMENKRKQAGAVGAQLIIVSDMIGNFSSSTIYRQEYF